VACDHLSLRVDQHRHVEAEGLDAARDLADLSWRMSARILRVEFELDNLPENDSDTAAVSTARLWKL
jgi:hypothetical protein